MVVRLVPVLPSRLVVSHRLAIVDPASLYVHLLALNRNVLLYVHLNAKVSVRRPPVAWPNAICLHVRYAQVPAILAAVNHATTGGRRMQISLYLYCKF